MPARKIEFLLPSLESPTPSLLCLEVQAHLPVLSGAGGGGGGQGEVVLFLNHSNFFLLLPEQTAARIMHHVGRPLNVKPKTAMDLRHQGDRATMAAYRPPTPSPEPARAQLNHESSVY